MANPSLVITNDGQGGLVVTDGLTGAEYGAPPVLVQLLVSFASGTSIDEVLSRFREDRHEELRAAFAELSAAGLVVPVARARRMSTGWSAIDRVFHQQVDRDDAGHVTSPIPPRARRARPAKSPISLARDAARPSGRFRDVLRARRSIRTFGRGALPLDCLAGFLLDAAASHEGRRPTPHASRHGLACNVVCYRVAGLEPGLYAYDAERHVLSFTAPLGSEGERLARRTMRSLRGQSGARPNVIVLSTARFAEELEGFRRIGYHLLLREAGAQLQTFYLVATDRGLAPCVLGAWESQRLDGWLGLDGIHDAVIGVFALGLRA